MKNILSALLCTGIYHKNVQILVLTSGMAMTPQIFAVDAFFTKVHYHLSSEPIDVIIPAVEKDLDTLNASIECIRKHGIGIRNIYVVSQKKLTDNALYFSEERYPFSKLSVAEEIITNAEKRERYAALSGNRIGWIYQQLLKFYAPFVIPGISSNVLVLDSDTIFLQPTSFMNAAGEPFFNPGTEYHKPYFEHGAKLLQGFRRMHDMSGISHHMLLQKPVLEYLFDVVKQQHHKEFWKAFCGCIDGEKLVAGQLNSCCSEFEIYFNFILASSNQAHIRKLKWANINSLNSVEQYQHDGYHYVSNHAYLRNRK